MSISVAGRPATLSCQRRACQRFGRVRRSGDAWSPEHLPLASVQSCFLFTLRAIARVSKVEFTRLELDATGMVDRKDGVTRFTEIVLRPKLTLPAGTNRERMRMLQILDKSKKTCLVSASLSTSLRLEPEIHEV